MEFTPYQVISPLIAFVAVAYAWNLVFRQKKTVWEAIAWTIFWGAIGLIAMFPGSIDYLTAATGIEDRENAVMVTFLGVIFFIVFYLVIRLEELEQKQTRIVRKVALRDAKLQNGKQ